MRELPVRRISKLTQRILSQNTGRDVDRLTLKMARLRQDPFAFLRGTNPLFLGFLPRAHFLFRAPRTLVCGDLHLENFGAFKGDNRLCYFDINDFDEACLAPFTVDIVRFLTAVKVAAKGLGLTRPQSRQLMERFVACYSASIRDGKPRWIERSLATGVFRALLRRATRRSRDELLDRFTKIRDGKRRLRIDGVRALPLQAGERARLDRFCSRLRLPSENPRFFELLDAGRRIAGNGSLGLERYILLVRGRTPPAGNFVLDLKYAAPSAVARWLRSGARGWAGEAHRVTSVQTIMQAVSPALLQTVEYRGRPFVLKELQPSIDRLDLSRWHDKPHRFVQAVEGMARVTAWAHLRGCAHHGAAAVEDLQGYTAGKRWAAAANRVAESAALRIDDAWATYCKDYDAGVVAAALT